MAWQQDPEYNQPYIEIREGEHYCTLCQKWATETHVQSSAHRRKAEWYAREYGIAPVVTNTRPVATPLQAPQQRTDNVHDLGFLVSEPWIIPQRSPQEEPYPYCTLCSSYATEGHLRSEKHQQRRQWPASYGWRPMLDQQALPAPQQHIQYPQAIAAGASSSASVAASVPASASASASASQGTTGVPGSDPELPRGWQKWWSSEHSQWYYYEDATQTSQWERPPPPPSVPHPQEEQVPPPPPPKATSYSHAPPAQHVSGPIPTQHPAPLATHTPYSAPSATHTTYPAPAATHTTYSAPSATPKAYTPPSATHTPYPVPLTTPVASTGYTTRSTPTPYPTPVVNQGAPSGWSGNPEELEEC